MELFLANFQNPQATLIKLVDHGLDGGGLAGTGIAGEQDVGCRLSFQQGYGVIDDDLLFPLVVDELVKTGLIRMLNRDDLTGGIQVEHMMFCVNTITKSVDVLTALPVAGRKI